MSQLAVSHFVPKISIVRPHANFTTFINFTR